MPTGYTAAIADGITFQQFALSCARAFGALIMMRDDPSDAPIPESFEPSNHHVEGLAKAKRRLEALYAMTSEERELATRAHIAEQTAYHSAEIAKNEALAAKYRDMLDCVLAWEAPSKDHDGLKRFMVEQITESIGFDCNSAYHENLLAEIGSLTAEEWLGKEVRSAQWEVEYHEKGQREELERVGGRNLWIQQLRESLK